MAIDPTVVYFGSFPTTIVLQCSAQMDGSAHTTFPVITPGVYTFPVQASGGLYDFHNRIGNGEPVTILAVSYVGGGTLTVNRVLTVASGTRTILIGTVAGAGELTFDEKSLILSPGETLTFSTSGATNPVVSITAMTARSLAGGL